MDDSFPGKISQSFIGPGYPGRENYCGGEEF